MKDYFIPKFRKEYLTYVKNPFTTYVDYMPKYIYSVGLMDKHKLFTADAPADFDLRPRKLQFNQKGGDSRTVSLNEMGVIEAF